MKAGKRAFPPIALPAAMSLSHSAAQPPLPSPVMEARLADHSRRLRARLSRHVLDAGPGRGWPRGPHPGRSRQSAHRRLRLRQGQPRPRAGALAAAPGDALAPRRPPRAKAASRRSRWDEALDEIVSRWKAIMARVGTAGAARLRLQRAPGADQPRPGQRPVPRARHQPPAGRHRVRHLLRDGLGPHGRAGRRRRSRNPSPSPT